MVKEKAYRLKGFSSLFGAAFIYGTFGVLIRFISPMFGNNFQVIARFFLAALFIYTFNVLTRKTLKLPKGTFLKVAILGVAFVCVVLLFTFSVVNTKLANSVFLFYAGGLISSFLIGTFVFKENVTTNKAIAIILALLGIAMYASAIFALSLGVIAGLGSGILDGVQNSLRRTLKGIDRNLVLQYSFVSGTIFAILVTIISGEQIIKTITIAPILVIIIYALLLLILGNLLLYGFQHFDVSVGTVILSMELVFATLFGFFLFKEMPTSREVLGGSLIFLASVLTGIDTKQLLRRLRKSSPPRN